jgi:hypothetical protein
LNAQPTKRGKVKRPLILLVALCLGSCVGMKTAAAQDSSSTKPAAGVSYSKDVAPILDKMCVSCHNADDQHPSELYMDSYDSLMKGGKHGKVIQPGNSKESLLSQKMTDDPPFGKKMPPSKRRMPTPEQIETLRQWIDQGAKKN